MLHLARFNFSFARWHQSALCVLQAENVRKQIMKAAVNGNVSAIFAIADVTNVHDFATLAAADFWPLHSAIAGWSIHRSEHLIVQTLHALMRFHADVNAQDDSGDTPLHKVLQVS